MLGQLGNCFEVVGRVERQVQNEIAGRRMVILWMRKRNMGKKSCYEISSALRWSNVIKNQKQRYNAPFGLCSR